VDKLLIAPVGDGDDYKYVKDFAENIYGIDISPHAVGKCNRNIITEVGDILHNPYSDDFFDLIVSPLFFHHVVSIGFDPFLEEFHRIMKKGGKLIILDFSIFYPLNSFTKPIKKIFNNPYGEVEDEKPFRPKLIINSLKKQGFAKIEVEAANYSHCLFPIPLARIINKITEPIHNHKILKNFSWLILFGASKPSQI
ncbi:MAG: methyltransferase domain-containing protein, partial [Candidatus Lokiarchaeota archaeon]|nr:methyltransferase domain-containing protein [Candidatus Lokiarchaeota archaeon]